MNTYYYAKLEDSENTIEKISARSLRDCQDKIVTNYMEVFDDLDDSVDFDDFLWDLSDKHDIFIGRIYESDELL